VIIADTILTRWTLALAEFRIVIREVRKIYGASQATANETPLPHNGRRFGTGGLLF
jgi:hypothetical protein